MTDIHVETLHLARQLIACRSITPADGGSLSLLADRLSSAGFVCERIDRGAVGNLWARHGSTGPLVCLAGHVDVVPTGPVGRVDERSVHPDGAQRPSVRPRRRRHESVSRRDDHGGRARRSRGYRAGSLAILLTSDEEGDAVDGTAAVVATLHARGETIDACIVGEPTSTERFGDTIKNGRRGSLNGRLRVHGQQCHIAYPERGRNPIHDAAPALEALIATEWDRGNEYFQPTRFQISNIHAGTGASNIIPGTMEVSFNFRFSSESSAPALQARVSEILDRHRLQYELEWTLIGEPFLTQRGPVVEALAAAVHAVVGRAACAFDEWRDVRRSLPRQDRARGRRVRAAQRVDSQDR